MHIHNKGLKSALQDPFDGVIYGCFSNNENHRIVYGDRKDTMPRKRITAEELRRYMKITKPKTSIT
jgi:hypothetical protein